MMTIKQLEVTVGEITKGYINNEEQGVRGYNGLLDIRPPYISESSSTTKPNNVPSSTPCLMNIRSM